MVLAGSRLSSSIDQATMNGPSNSTAANKPGVITASCARVVNVRFSRGHRECPRLLGTPWRKCDLNVRHPWVRTKPRLTGFWLIWPGWCR